MAVKDNTEALRVILAALQAMAGGACADGSASEAGENGQDSA